MIALGIDPDTHNTAVSITVPECVVAVKVFKVPTKITGQKAVEQMIEVVTDELPVWLEEMRSMLRGSINVIVSEGQKITRLTKNWKSVVMIAPITGATAAIARACTRAPVLVPLPAEWKGTIPKHAKQAHILRARGYAWEKCGGKEPYCIPKDGMPGVHGAAELTKTGWKHAVDAVGLADWGLEWLRRPA